jgi:hypothetical protein
LVRGAGGNPGLGGPFVNNVFNREAQKSLPSTSTPLIFVTGFSYTTPRVGPNRVVEQLLGNWTVGGLLRYASGALIHAPFSNNNIFPLHFQSTLQNRVPGVPLFIKDPNGGNIDPRCDLVLNPAGWVDAPPGQFSNSSGYFNDYRWQRQVSENMLNGLFPRSNYTRVRAFRPRSAPILLQAFHCQFHYSTDLAFVRWTAKQPRGSRW